MRGVGRATGAVTIVNALPTGVGSALGVDLPIEVTLEPGGPVGGPRSPPSFADAALSDAVAWLDGPDPSTARLEVRSQIPPRKGLKSSSALGVAIVRAAAAAVGRTVAPEGAARRCAQVARSFGASATGAFDDALAASSPGFVLTDNAANRVLRTAPPPVDCVAVLDLGAGEHRAPVEYRERFSLLREVAAEAVDAARRGDWWTAMDRNSAVVERALGLELRSRRKQAVAAGAHGAGVSGLGPAFAAIVPRAALPRYLREGPRPAGLRRIVDVVGPTPVRAEGP